MQETITELGKDFLTAWAAAAGLGVTPVDSPSVGVVEWIQKLSSRFVRPQETERWPYADHSDALAAYVLYYLPVNAAKIQCLLQEMPAPAPISGQRLRPFRVLDVGCGPGTGALAVLDWVCRQSALYRPGLDFTAVDASKLALQWCARLWRSYGQASKHDALATISGNLEECKFLNPLRNAKRSFDLIIVSNVLNELFVDRSDPLGRRYELMGLLLELLDHEGTLMVVEPALRQASRDLHELRDRLLRQGGYSVFSPCLHDRFCSALARETDWCHEDRPWIPPAAIRAMDRRIGFIKDSLKFSYLLLRKDQKHIVQREPGRFRVVSEVRRMKGEARAWLCHENGRLEIGRLDRDASPVNSAFENWHRGAIVQIDQLAHAESSNRRGGLARIRKQTSVEVLNPSLSPEWKDNGGD